MTFVFKQFDSWRDFTSFLLEQAIQELTRLFSNTSSFIQSSTSLEFSSWTLGSGDVLSLWATESHTGCEKRLCFESCLQIISSSGYFSLNFFITSNFFSCLSNINCWSGTGLGMFLTLYIEVAWIIFSAHSSLFLFLFFKAILHLILKYPRFPRQSVMRLASQTAYF